METIGSSARWALVFVLAGLLLPVRTTTAQPADDAAGDVLHVDPTAVTSLVGDWAFRAGDDLRWAAPDFDDSDWLVARVPAGFERHGDREARAWYRRTIDLARGARELSEVERATLHLGVTIGKVDSAYELWAGGERIGGVGSLPPDPAIAYDRHGTYRVPPSAIAPDGRLVLSLRVWASPETRSSVGGPQEGPFRIGPMEDLVRREILADWPLLFFGGWFALLGIFHLELYRRRPQLRGYLWFALLALLFGLYSLLRTQAKYSLGLDFRTLKEIEHLTLYLDTALFIEVLWPLLGLHIGPILRSVQVACLTTGLFLIVTPGLAANLAVLPVWQLTVLGITAAGLWQIVRQAWRRHPEARLLAIGAVLAAASFLHDAAVDRGFYAAPRVSTLGFALFVTGLALSLANRFVRIHAEVEDLRRSEEANRVKSDFLANMSHELRTPITGILGTADLLRRFDLPQRAHEYADTVHASAESLLAIVDDVLDFSKVEAGRLELEHIVFPLRETVRGVVDLLTPRAHAKRLELTFDLDPHAPRHVVGDPLRLRQVLLNLVGNAVKFTEAGRVDVRVERLDRGKRRRTEPAHLRFVVRDTGIGISGADRERLFLPFTQADSSTTRRFGGTGLGLSISRRIVEAMGGRLTLESEPGVGSTFTFDLELPVAAAPAESPTREPSSSSSYAPVGRRILLAEDNPVNRMVAEELLAALGHEVTVVEHGRAALDLVEAEPFDVVLMDCQMPVMDGYEATRRIRQREVGDRHLPIIALTAHALAGDREKCLAAGMDDYLTKPFTAETLGAALRPWLGRGE